MVESAGDRPLLGGLAGAAAEPAPGGSDADPRGGTTTAAGSGREGRPEVVLISVQGGGHSLPRVSFLVLGRTSHDFSGAEEIWRFFGRAGRYHDSRRGG
jgi:poly(3-hydroxybutyrate) depolymerase